MIQKVPNCHNIQPLSVKTSVLQLAGLYHYLDPEMKTTVVGIMVFAVLEFSRVC